MQVSIRKITEGVWKKLDKPIGYNIRLLQPLPDKFKCPFCEKLMRDPIQTIRGNFACDYCYEKEKKTRHLKDTCPLDEENILATQIFKDIGKKKEIEALLCECKNTSYNCDWQGIVRDIEKHQLQCAFKPPKCFCCEKSVAEENVEKHLLNSCPVFRIQAKCIHEELGCHYKPADSAGLLRHIKDNVYLHLLQVSNIMTVLQSQHNILSQEISHQHQQICQMHQRNREDMSKIEEEVLSIQNNMAVLQQQREEGITHLHAKLKEMRDFNITTVSVARQAEMNDETKTQGTEIFQLNDKLATMGMKMSHLDLKQQLYENTNYDGRILWKIDKLTHRLEQAVSGAVTALHSAPAFTCKYGYKFCGRLYLNGDGIGKHTHMSLFYVTMKSEYDGLLSWPFKKTITFRLINLQNRSNDLEERFLADENSNSFQRPTGEMNVAAGCPNFITRAHLLNGGFVKDDALYIEIIVV